MKDLYTSCMDETTIKKVGIAPLVSILSNISDHFDGNDAIPSAFAYLWSLGVSPLVSANVGADDKHPDTVVVSIWNGGIGLPSKEYYKDEKIVAKYQSVLYQVLTKIYPEKAIPNATFDAVIEFEKKVAAISPDNADRNDVTVSIQHMILQEVVVNHNSLENISPYASQRHSGFDSPAWPGRSGSELRSRR